MAENNTQNHHWKGRSMNMQTRAFVHAEDERMEAQTDERLCFLCG